ncbi:MAG: DEAD/DEAH box helicase [Candidatus Scalindua sp.]|nr:DEAD/DEAH box helicase [Candidatus Scalindua sp.]MCR4344319.1 DEAD/DEAH box helicase [Candidatus Scalindua sp.]
MSYHPENPMIVQSDKTILLEVDHPGYEDARDELARFAELEKSPEHIHTYRITPLSLWNAASSGVTDDTIIEIFNKYSKYDVPQNIVEDIKDNISRYGKLKLIKRDGDFLITSDDQYLITEITHNKHVIPLIKQQLNHLEFTIAPLNRGHIKQVLIKIGFPVEDIAGYEDGDAMTFSLRDNLLSNNLPFAMREYQHEAIEVFYAKGSATGGNGVLVLPCGAGKTILGLAIMEKYQYQTLILATNITALRQWRDEIVDKTSLCSEDIGEYSGEKKEIKPITITTYQIMTFRKKKEDDFLHLELFNKQNWGLIIYDEVHLLPAPVFRTTAEIQSKRRLGLTATLVREDGLEDDVFSLIGPKKYDVPWKVLEKQGWIAEALCTEIRVPLAEELRMEYAVAELREKFRISSENPLKNNIIRKLLIKHDDDNVLVIGQYISQLKIISTELNAPLITGKTSNPEREKLYGEFKCGNLKILVVSKVANFAINLPDANVAIQVSGTFGSRQEEAQRLGRILRPKRGENRAHFYSLITRDTRDQDFAVKRQLFLTEQGYQYEIHDYEDVLKEKEI